MTKPLAMYAVILTASPLDYIQGLADTLAGAPLLALLIAVVAGILSTAT